MAGRREETVNFGQNTSIHTIWKHTVSEIGIRRRIIWLILLLASCGYLLYEMYILGKLYLEYPVRIRNRVTVNHSLEFPSVTVCNLNSLRQSKLRNSAFMNEIDAVRVNITDKAFLNSLTRF